MVFILGVKKLQRIYQSNVFIAILIMAVIVLSALLIWLSQSKTEIVQHANNSLEEYDAVFEGLVLYSEVLCYEDTHAILVEVSTIYNNDVNKPVLVGDELAIPYNEPLNISEGDSVFIKCNGIWACVDFPNPDDPPPCQGLSGGCGFHCTYAIIGKLN